MHGRRARTTYLRTTPDRLIALVLATSILLLMMLPSACTETSPSEPPPDKVTKDDTPPAAVVDLSVVDSTASSITLVWTAPGDDGTSGTAATYDIRYTTSTMNVSRWPTAEIVKNPPSPGSAGSRDTCTVTNLDLDTDYSFALKTSDERSNWSELSNVASGRTVVSASPWREIDLDISPGDSRLVAVDFTGNYGMAVAVIVAENGSFSHNFFRLQSDGSWLKVDLGVTRSNFAILDLALDTTGVPVFAGMQMVAPHSLVLDMRGGSPHYIEQYSYGMLTVDGSGSFMVAGGRSSGGGLWTSTAAADWHFDNLPLTGGHDSGFFDVSIRGDKAVATGYDDGNDTDLRVILTRTASTDWTKVALDNSFARTDWCIALDQDETIYLGGIQGAGSQHPAAFLSRREPGGTWADIFLPDPEQLRGVRDILIAADGNLYLACQGEGDDSEANLVRVGAVSGFREITPFSGGLFQVGQAADRAIYAVGFRRDATGAERGVMLVRGR